MKTCTKCGHSKPPEAFYSSAGTSWCRTCFSADMRRRRAAWVPPDSPPRTKKCGHCQLEKAAELFGRLIGTSTGLHSWCKACQADRSRQRRIENPDRIRRIKYGMPPGQYDAMAREQQYACAICRRRRTLLVDHCHVSGVVRGLLCKPCNTAIGFFEDSPGALRSAAAYVELTAIKRTA